MYTYLIGWTKHDKYYYGVRYSKNCDPNELWKSYFTSSNYVREFRKEYGEPDIIEVRKTFSDKKKAILWEHKVLRRLNAVFSDKWLNKTDNMAIDFYKMKHNTIPGMIAAREKIKGKSYEDFFKDKTLIEERKKKSSLTCKKNWSNADLRKRMSTKPSDTSKYREAALKRWANEEEREKLCASMRGVPKKLREV